MTNNNEAAVYTDEKQGNNISLDFSFQLESYMAVTNILKGTLMQI